MRPGRLPETVPFRYRCSIDRPLLSRSNFPYSRCQCNTRGEFGKLVGISGFVINLPARDVPRGRDANSAFLRRPGVSILILRRMVFNVRRGRVLRTGAAKVEKKSRVSQVVRVRNFALFFRVIAILFACSVAASGIFRDLNPRSARSFFFFFFTARHFAIRRIFRRSSTLPQKRLVSRRRDRGGFLSRDLLRISMR